MADEKEYVLGRQVLHEDDLIFTVDYNNESFSMRYPTTLVRTQIEADVARRIGGVPRDAVDPEVLALIQMTAYVNAIILPDRCPKWFREDVSSLWEHYDEMLVITLYRGYADFRDRFRDKLSQGGFEVGRAGVVPRPVGVQPLPGAADGPSVQGAQ